MWELIRWSKFTSRPLLSLMLLSRPICSANCAGSAARPMADERSLAAPCSLPKAMLAMLTIAFNSSRAALHLNMSLAGTTFGRQIGTREESNVWVPDEKQASSANFEALDSRVSALTVSQARRSRRAQVFKNRGFDGRQVAQAQAVGRLRARHAQHAQADVATRGETWTYVMGMARSSQW